jgi:hypothetical protein
MNLSAERPDPIQIVTMTPVSEPTFSGAAGEAADSPNASSSGQVVVLRAVT